MDFSDCSSANTVFLLLVTCHYPSSSSVPAQPCPTLQNSLSNIVLFHLTTYALVFNMHMIKGTYIFSSMYFYICSRPMMVGKTWLTELSSSGVTSVFPALILSPINSPFQSSCCEIKIFIFISYNNNFAVCYFILPKIYIYKDQTLNWN